MFTMAYGPLVAPTSNHQPTSQPSPPLLQSAAATAEAEASSLQQQLAHALDAADARAQELERESRRQFDRAEAASKALQAAEKQLEQATTSGAPFVFRCACVDLHTCLAYGIYDLFVVWFWVSMALGRCVGERERERGRERELCVRLCMGGG